MRLQPDANYKSNDIVFTPRPLAKRIIKHFDIQGSVLDPCMGNGAFFDQLPDSCEKYWCEISKGADFYGFDKHVDWCISNPPYSIFRNFLIHSMQISDNIVYLITVNHIWTKAHIKDIRKFGFGIREIFCVNSPSNFPPSGFQYGAIHFKRGYSGDIKLSFDESSEQSLLKI